MATGTRIGFFSARRECPLLPNSGRESAFAFTSEAGGIADDSSAGPVGPRFVRVMIAAPEFEGFRTTQLIDRAEQQKFNAKGGGRRVLYAEEVIAL